LKNGGLEFSHIISKKIDKGTDREENCLVLCKKCAYSFDYVLKPVIYNAFKTYKKETIPESWKIAEGRLNPDNP
jgi:hypothetical protein